jgi:hypothetical protein
VRVVVADDRPPAPAAVRLGAVATDAVAGAQEVGLAAGVHVRQLAGAGPLVAVGRLLLRLRRPRDPRPAEHLPDRRVRKAGRACDQPAVPPTMRRRQRCR